MNVTNTLYKLARASADARAISRGPGAVGKRILRKAAGRAYGRAMRKILP